MANAVRAAESIVAGEVSVRASAVRSVSGGDVDLRQSAVQRLRGEEVHIKDSAVAAVAAQEVHVDDANVGLVAARQAHLRRVRTVVLLAPRVEGDVRTVFDWKGAIAIGVGIVLTRRLLKLLRLG